MIDIEEYLDRVERDEIKLFHMQIPERLACEINDLLRAWGYRIYFEGKCLDVNQLVFKKDE